MSKGLAEYARIYLSDPGGFLSNVRWPVLLWQSTEAFNPADEQWDVTDAGGREKADRPRPGESLIFELKKEPSKNNPFAMGITLGRVGTNDVVIDDSSISRFHAWFQQEPKSGAWVLVDAESKNGSWANGLKLSPNVKAAIGDQARLRFGEIDLVFMLPATLVARLERDFAGGRAAQASKR